MKKKKNQVPADFFSVLSDVIVQLGKKNTEGPLKVINASFYCVLSDGLLKYCNDDGLF